MTGEKLLTACELADLLSLSSATVLDRWERGDLPGFRLFGRKGGPVSFRLSEIEAKLETWRAGPRPVCERPRGSYDRTMRDTSTYSHCCEAALGSRAGARIAAPEGHRVRRSDDA